MDAITAKVECLKLAAERRETPDAGQTLKDAETYWRWVIDRDSPDSHPARSEGTPDRS